LNEFIDQYFDAGFDPFQFGRLACFHQFRDRIGPPPVRQTPFFTTYSLEIGNEKIGIASLDTAWRCTGEPNDVDRGTLLVGERAVREALNDLDGCTVKIAMMHHPRAWLREFDENDCWSLLVREADLILTGHMHRSKPESVRNPLGQAVTSEGGALYVSRTYFNGYCVVRIDRQANTAKFFIRRYEDTRTCFEPATNVAAEGEFVAELASTEAARRLARLSITLQALRPVIHELASEKLVTPESDDMRWSNFSSVYVTIRLSDRSFFERASSDTMAKVGRISEADILNCVAPVVVRGSRETGKTVLGLKLCLDACEGLKPDVKIPVFIDLALMRAGTEYIERKTREFLGRAESPLKVSDYLRDGALFFVFDNFAIRERNKQGRERKIKMVAEFIRRYPSNKFVLLSDMNEADSVGLSEPEDFGFDHTVYYIDALGRTEIRQFGRCWLEPLGMYSEALVNSVERKLATYHLPRTPQVLAIIFWTIGKEGSLGTINEATLLERFIEACLNKSNLREVERGSLDYRIKETFLSHLADDLSLREIPVIPKNELLQFAIEFFQKRSWPSDSAIFVQDLISSGILSESYLEGGSIEVTFRYRCLREFFFARYMIDNQDRFDGIVESAEIVDFDRELDLLTGLLRTDKGIIQRLTARVKELSLQFDSTAVEEAFRSLRFRTFDPLKHISETVETFAKTPLTDADADGLAGEGPAPATTELADRARIRRVRPSSQPASEFLYTALLLSRIVRNSELLPDAESKLNGVSAASEAWTTLTGLGIRLFDLLHDDNGAEDSAPAFREMSETERSQLERTLKCSLPVLGAFAFYLAMGSRLLGEVLEGALKIFPDRADGRRFMLTCVLLNMTFLDGYENDQSVIRIIRGMISDKKANQHHLYLLLEALSLIYHQSGLGDKNRNLIEELMGEVNLSIRGIQPHTRRDFGTVRDRTVQAVRRNLRQKLDE
jgi:hypothetical protein